MRGLTAAALAASVGMLASLSTPAFAAEGVTWRRDHVRQVEIAALERALGKEFAAQLRLRPHIVGGFKAAPGQWPFQVALLDASTPNNANAQFCGGALIDKLFVVTAAHCVFGSRAAEIDVLTGTQSLAIGGARRHVAAITIHPGYNDNTLDFDIAVIKLKTAATGIAVSRLVSNVQEKPLASAGTKTWVTGWGSTKASGGGYPKDLYQVGVPIVSTAVCNGKNSYDGEITARMICAGFKNGGKDSCDGDSGGPMIVKDSLGRWRAQAGIVSWGDGCAQPNLYGVYSRVAVLSSWASHVVAGLAPVHASADCERLRGLPQLACLDAAISENQREIRSYLVELRAGTTSARNSVITASQRTWASSLESSCASRATAERKLCVLKQMEKRAAALAEKMSLAAD
ncbi:MAG: serine protease [Pseudolabrys sp.]